MDNQNSTSFICQGCKCEVPSTYSMRTVGYCYLCDPNISVQELLSDDPINPVRRLKTIQTPLIDNGYIKGINEKWFIVSSDSLAPVIWRGYELYCIPVAHNELPEAGDFVVVECYVPNRKRVFHQIGFFEGVNNERLTLDYDYEELKEPIAKWSIPVIQIKRIYLIDRSGKDYARMAKFYPTTHKYSLP